MFSDLQKVHVRNLVLYVFEQQYKLKRTPFFLFSALSCPSPIVSHVLKDSSQLAYTITGYNALLGRKHLKTVDPQYVICADVIRQIRLQAGSRDSELNDLVTTISTN